MGISRDSAHKRRSTGGRMIRMRMKRKFEMGRQPAGTKIGDKKITRIRVRGGNYKFRALRLDQGNFAWAGEAVTRKTRILKVIYNATNNELVRTNTLVKGSIIQIDSTPFKSWYLQYYNIDLAKKKDVVIDSKKGGKIDDKKGADKKGAAKDDKKGANKKAPAKDDKKGSKGKEVKPAAKDDKKGSKGKEAKPAAKDDKKGSKGKEAKPAAKDDKKGSKGKEAKPAAKDDKKGSKGKAATTDKKGSKGKETKPADDKKGSKGKDKKKGEKEEKKSERKSEKASGKGSGKGSGKKAKKEEIVVAEKTSNLAKYKKRGVNRFVDEPLMEQFKTGRIYAKITSRPGQSGRCDGYILEGDELAFYLKKINLKKKKN